MMNTAGTKPLRTERLVTTVAYQLGPDQPIHYAVEGGLWHCASTIPWLCHSLQINDPHDTRGDGTLGHAAEPWLVLCTRLLWACLPPNGDPMVGPVGWAGRLGMTRDMCVCVVLPSKHRPVKSGKPWWRVVAAAAAAAVVTQTRSTLVCATQPSLEVTCLQVDGGGTEHKLITISGRYSPCSSHPTCRRHQGTCQSRCRLLRRSGPWRVEGRKSPRLEKNPTSKTRSTPHHMSLPERTVHWNGWNKAVCKSLECAVLWVILKIVPVWMHHHLATTTMERNHTGWPRMPPIH